MIITSGHLGVGLFNDVSQILPRPTLVELKLAITRLICEISLRFLRLPGGFRGRAIERFRELMRKVYIRLVTI